MTAKARVLILPVLVVGLLLFAGGAWYLWLGCSVDGRESPGDKHEWSILQSLEARHKEHAASRLEFLQEEEYHILSLQPSTGAARIWIMLNPQSPPFYKQMPSDNYSLSEDEYDRIVATRYATSTVEEVLRSHVR